MNNSNNSSENSTPLSLLETEGEKAKMSRPYRFFAWCAGANIDVLKHFPTEFNKYFGAGALICMTGLFAFIASAYALSTIFKGGGLFFPIIVGMVWGLFIFLLDRYLVGSMSKNNSFWKQVFLALPRIFLAILIALTIARPLELRIFSTEIEQQLITNKESALNSIDSTFKQRRVELDSIFRQNQVPSNNEKVLLEEKQNIQSAMQTSRDEIKRLTDVLNAEMDGSDQNFGSGKRGYGRIARRKEQQLEEAQNAYNNQLPGWNNRINQIDNELKILGEQKTQMLTSLNKNYQDQIEGLENEKEDAIANAQNIQMSLLNQNKALHQMMKNDRSVYSMVFVITLLFVILECAPLLAKVLMSRGPYDDALDDIEQEFRQISQQRRFLARQESNINKNMIVDLANSQREVIRKAMQNWKEKQLQRVDDYEEDLFEN
jgi:hypothetical protein